MHQSRPPPRESFAPACRVVARLAGVLFAFLLSLLPLRESFADEPGMQGIVVSHALFQFDGGQLREV